MAQTLGGGGDQLPGQRRQPLLARLLLAAVPPLLVLLLLMVAEIPAVAALRVFYVPHSHQDTGWLKTIDEFVLRACTAVLQRRGPNEATIWHAHA